MSYRVETRPAVRRNLAALGLSDAVLVDVYLRLQELRDDPWRFLRRTNDPFDGLTYGFTLIDPGNRLCVHAFAFQVFYSQDEETLFVVRGEYGRLTSF